MPFSPLLFTSMRTARIDAQVTLIDDGRRCPHMGRICQTRYVSAGPTVTSDSGRLRMTRYVISFDDGAMKFFLDLHFPRV